jgi:epoxyqueuosine reductase
MDTSARVLEIALESGFDLAGIAPLRPPRDAERFERWLGAGRHAGMEWLARNRARITDPRRILPEGRSLLLVGAGHGRPAVELRGGGRVARYAAGRDYHNWMGRRLKRLARRLVAAGIAARTRTVVDAGPVLERSHAAEAGLGFPSKAANLLHPDHGPWFFLGEILLDAELEPTTRAPSGSCGTCTACLDACPTHAILEPGVVDSNRCISYHTIENRGSIPSELRAAVSEWAFGCDVCSEVCPWGREAPDSSARFGSHPAVERGSLVDWLSRKPAAADAELEGSPLRRARREGLARNAALGLARYPSDAGRSALLAALADDPSPVVRETAYWSLSRAHGADAGVAGALERARLREDDGEARARMEETDAG